MTVTPYAGLTLKIEAALSADTGSYGLWEEATWDTSTWGPSLIWTDISEYVMDFSIKRGRPRAINQYETGTCELTLENNDARFSPWNLAGPYVLGGITQIRPWLPVRIIATYNTQDYPLFYGYSQGWPEDYGTSAKFNTTRIRLVDEFGKLAKTNGYEQTPVGAGELSGLRIHRLLDFGGCTAPRDIDLGTATMQATTLAQNLVSMLKLTADSEDGAIYVKADGTVAFKNRLSLFESARSKTVQSTFNHDGTDLRYLSVLPEFSSDLFYNAAAIARSGGTAQTARDEDSIALYGVTAQYSRFDLICELDSQCQTIADWMVARFAQPQQRVKRITIDPRVKPSTHWPEVLGRELRDRVIVRFKPRGMSTTVEQNCFVEEISHKWTRNRQWETAYGFSNADIYSSSVGLWDSATWDSSTWFY